MIAFSKHTVRPVLGLVLGFAMIVAAMCVSACNTTEGVGKDIKAAGSGIENAASDAKR